MKSWKVAQIFSLKAMEERGLIYKVVDLYHDETLPFCGVSLEASLCCL